MLVAPHLVSTAVAGPEPPAPSWLVRMLGGRLIGQGGLLLVRPTPGVLAVGRAIDILHGSSMLFAATARPAYRRSALTSGAVAAGSVLVSVAVRK
jgi:hypothetical protein